MMQTAVGRTIKCTTLIKFHLTICYIILIQQSCNKYLCIKCDYHRICGVNIDSARDEVHMVKFENGGQ